MHLGWKLWEEQGRSQPPVSPHPLLGTLLGAKEASALGGVLSGRAGWTYSPLRSRPGP